MIFCNKYITKNFGIKTRNIKIFSYLGEDMKCPVCKESIKDGARKCRYCGEGIPEEPKKSVRHCSLCRFFRFARCARFVACIIYVIVGIVCFLWFRNIKNPILLDYKAYLSQILWCFGWGAIGIALGLWNSRNAEGEVLDKWWHYGAYFLFVLAIAALAAFVAFEMNKTNLVLSYAVATLTGLIVGFVGDSLSEKFISLVK